MLILALETSGFGGSIALLNGDELLGERILDAQRRHAQTLVPEVLSLLQEHGRQATDCELIAISTGPGSFTGLRVGITFAKTMSYATGAKVAAVPTFPCLAAGCPDDVARVQVIMNAQRQEFFVGRFERTDGLDWVESRPLSIERVADWQQKLEPADVVTGPGVEPIAAEIATHCRVLLPEFWQPQAKWVGRLGYRMSQLEQLTTGWELSPLYVRKSAAEEKWDATHPVPNHSNPVQPT